MKNPDHIGRSPLRDFAATLAFPAEHYFPPVSVDHQVFSRLISISVKSLEILWIPFLQGFHKFV